jgi:hypothetical protein
MLNLILAVLGAAVVFASLMPLLKSGGQTIAAFMMGREVLRHLTALLCHIIALVLGVFLAFLLVKSSDAPFDRLLAAMLMLATVYAANWLINKILFKHTL